MAERQEKIYSTSGAGKVVTWDENVPIPTICYALC